MFPFLRLNYQKSFLLFKMFSCGFSFHSPPLLPLPSQRADSCKDGECSPFSSPNSFLSTWAPPFPMQRLFPVCVFPSESPRLPSARFLYSSLEPPLPRTPFCGCPLLPPSDALANFLNKEYGLASRHFPFFHFSDGLVNFPPPPPPSGIPFLFLPPNCRSLPVHKDRVLFFFFFLFFLLFVSFFFFFFLFFLSTFPSFKSLSPLVKEERL